MQQACIRPKGTVRVGMRMLGCITQAYTLCARPAPHLYSFKTKDRAWSQQQRHQQFNGYGTLYLWSKVLERHHPTGCGRQMSVDRTRQQSCWGWVWGLPVIGESHLIGSLATRETRRGTRPSPPQLEQSLAAVWGKYEGRSVLWAGCRWSTTRSRRGCTNSNRIAIASGLAIQRASRLMTGNVNQGQWLGTKATDTFTMFSSEECRLRENTYNNLNTLKSETL